MNDVVLTRDLLREPHHPSEIAAMARRGELTSLRRGAWARTVEGVERPGARENHRQLITATVGLISPDAVLSHISAAVLHGLPVWPSRLGQVHWTRNRNSGGRALKQIHVYAAPLAPHEVVLVDGLAVTSLERTVIDLARHLPFVQAVAAADAALHLGLDRGVLADSVESAKRRPGNGRARRVVGFADGRSESAGESWSRVEWCRLGRPPSHLQYEIVDTDGVVIARSDFCWEEQRLIGEFDGQVKYTTLLRPGETASDVVIREKNRENAIRRLDWGVLRWDWSDLHTPMTLAQRFDSAVLPRRN